MSSTPTSGTTAIPPGSAQRGMLTSLLELFWATVVVFVLLLLMFFVIQDLVPDKRNFFELGILPCVALLTLLGILLIVSAARAPITRGFKWCLVLTGFAAVGIPFSAVMHNLVYGLMIYIFGRDFWGGEPGHGGGDEPVFFLLALIVFPLLFIVSTLIAAAIYARSRDAVVKQAHE